MNATALRERLDALDLPREWISTPAIAGLIDMTLKTLERGGFEKKRGAAHIVTILIELLERRENEERVLRDLCDRMAAAAAKGNVDGSS